MLKRWIWAPLLLAATPAMAQEQPPQQAPTATQFAGMLQSLVGQKFEGDVTIHAVTAEQNVVIFTIDGPKDWRGTLSSDDISAALLSGFCGNAPNFFETGILLRVDTTEAAEGLVKGKPLNQCPRKAE